MCTLPTVKPTESQCPLEIFSKAERLCGVPHQLLKADRKRLRLWRVETNSGIESGGGVDSFGNFCGRAIIIDSFVEESSPIPITNPRRKVGENALDTSTGKKSNSNGLSKRLLMLHNFFITILFHQV
jgi:hypothetical protein